MNQFDIKSHSDAAGLAAAYRAGPGGDFSATPSGAPEAKIQASPTDGAVPLVVSFDGSKSVDPDGTIASYTWDFGDGETATGSSTTHTYQFAGKFAAKLTVTDDKGNKGVASVTVKTTNSQVVIVDNADPSPSFTSKGGWPTNSVRPGYYGANYALNTVGNGGDWARWRPELVSTGSYRVSASWSTDADRPTAALFKGSSTPWVSATGVQCCQRNPETRGCVRSRGTSCRASRRMARRSVPHDELGAYAFALGAEGHGGAEFELLVGQ